MTNSMISITPEELATTILNKLKEEKHQFWIDPETHSEQHAFLQTLIEERAEKVLRRKKLEDFIAGSLILSGTLGIIALVGSGVLEWIRLHLK